MTNGVPVAVPETPADAVVIHTFDEGDTRDPSGRPYLDVVTLVVQNNNTDVEAGDAIVTIEVSGVPLVVRVPIGEQVVVLDETPFGGVLSAASGGGGEITLVGAAGGDSDECVAWGWFVRTEG